MIPGRCRKSRTDSIGRFARRITRMTAPTRPKNVSLGCRLLAIVYSLRDCDAPGYGKVTCMKTERAPHNAAPVLLCTSAAQRNYIMS
jgi:hypothetical protein